MKSITIELPPLPNMPGSHLRGELITQRWGWTLNAPATNYRPCNSGCSNPNNYLVDFDTSLHAGGSYALTLKQVAPFLCEETCERPQPRVGFGRANCEDAGCPNVCDSKTYTFEGVCLGHVEGFASNKINSRQFSAAHYVARDPGIVKIPIEVPEPSVSGLLICGVILLAILKRGKRC